MSEVGCSNAITDPYSWIKEGATAEEIAALMPTSFQTPSVLESAKLWQSRDQSTEKAEGWQVRYALLRFAVNDESTRVFTSARENKALALDRDRFVVDLWHTIARDDRDALLKRFHSMRYHRRRLFDWLVDRYALTCARDILGLRSWPAWLPLGGALVALFFNWRDTVAERRVAGLWSLAVGYLAATVIAIVWRKRNSPAGLGEAAFFFLQSLIPRLLGTAAAGALLLLTGSSLLEWIVAARPEISLLGSLAVFGAASAYLLLEMLNRLEPAPKWTAVAGRLAEVVALAMTHSTLLTLLLWPAFSKLSNVCNAGFHQLVSVIVALFATGLVLNVIWAEEPITHPL